MHLRFINFVFSRREVEKSRMILENILYLFNHNCAFQKVFFKMSDMKTKIDV